MNPVENEEYTDVVELCALLQCLNFNVKSLDMSDANMSQDGGSKAVKTIVINCQSSGLHVVLESESAACSCPAPAQQNSGFWQVEAVSGGKQIDKECGSVLLGSFPKSFKERLSKNIQGLIKSIKEQHESNADVEKSASMTDIKTTPEKSLAEIKVDTPTRYRSLDTLTNNKDGAGGLPPPGSLLAKQVLGIDTSTDDLPNDALKKSMFRRQSTYTVKSAPDSIKRRNKTSSPIQELENTVLENLIAAEKSAEDLRNKLAAIIKEFDEDKLNSSMSSLALDVSKISVLKGPESKPQFVSSPNLSGLQTLHEDVLTKNMPKRFESASTSNLSPSGGTPKEGVSKFTSKLRRLSPNIFKRNKDSPTLKVDKDARASDSAPKSTTCNEDDKRAPLIRQYTDNLPDVKIDKIRTVLEQLKNNEVPGEDGTTTKLLKAEGYPILGQLQDLFNAAIRTETTAKECICL